jgi:Transposase/Transposase IS116/IS110/IS902 family
VVLFVGDDWAEDHHDVEVQDETGRVLARARLPEGAAGLARLHALVGARLGEDDGPGEVSIGIETDRGPWVQALVAAGYVVYPINPRQAARFRERHSGSGAKSDQGDAHMLADAVRTDRHQLRRAAGDSGQVEAVKLVARAHQRLVWERTRHAARLRAALRESFPAALAAFPDLDAPDALELLAEAPDPVSAAGLSEERIAAALRRARRRGVAGKAAAVAAALRAEQLGQPEALVAAYAAVVRSQVAVIAALDTQVKEMEKEVGAHFGGHRDAEIYLSQPGFGVVTGARALGEFGDDPGRYADAKSRKNYAGTSPITRRSGKKKTVHARFVRNDRLGDALRAQAFSALSTSAGARAYYDALRARGTEHEPALRQLGNRLVGIPRGCLKARTVYDEATAWGHHARWPDQAAPPPRRGRQPRGPDAGWPVEGSLPKAS